MIKALNLGCGRDYRVSDRIEWTNVDFNKNVDADVYWDLNKKPWPFKDNEFDYVYCPSGIICMLDDFMGSMEEIWRVAKGGGIINIEVPLFPSQPSVSDPHIKKQMTYSSFDYFVPGNKFNYYSKARFRIISRKVKISENRWLRWMDIFAAFWPKFYHRFLIGILPANRMDIKLMVVKEETYDEI